MFVKKLFEKLTFNVVMSYEMVYLEKHNTSIKYISSCNDVRANT
jgi:hypothetical protein